MPARKITRTTSGGTGKSPEKHLRGDPSSTHKSEAKQEHMTIKMHCKSIQNRINEKIKHEVQAEGAEAEEFKSSFRRSCYMVLHSPFFEHTVCSIILLNLVLIIYETDLAATGEVSGSWVSVCYWTILLVFVLESSLRLIVLRSKFWLSAINVWDLLVVCLDLSLSTKAALTTSSQDGVVGVSAARFLRLIRLIRATKALAVFPELRLMMRGLAGASSSIIWGTVLLFFALIIWGVLAVQLIQPLNEEVAATGAYDGCDRCIRAYASTWQAALTFTTQIVCGDSWSRETVPIIEAFPWTIFFFMGVFLSIGMALLNLILGVVVNAATEARENIVKELALKDQMRHLNSRNRLVALCEQMDVDGSGELSSDEIINGFNTNEEFKATINDLGIHDHHDLDVVWCISDDEKTGSVSYKHLVSQIYTMKSSELDYMLAYIKYFITQVRDDISKDMGNVEKDLGGEISRGTLKIEQDFADFAGHISPANAAVTSGADNRNIASPGWLYRPALDQEDAQVKMPAPNYNQDAKLVEEKKFNSRLQEMPPMRASSMSGSSEPLVSHLKDLRAHFLTSSEEMRRAHVEMLESTIQTMCASIPQSQLQQPARPASSSNILLM